MIKLPGNWKITKYTPPEQLLELRDEQGRIVKGKPTYYDFKIINGEIVHCEPYWDGGFIFESSLDCEFGSVTAWREIKE